MIRYFFFIIFFIITIVSKSQDSCYLLKKNNYKEIKKISYPLSDKLNLKIPVNTSVYIKIREVSYKEKLLFVFYFYNLGDTIEVKLVTLNRILITSKKITKKDNIFKTPPFKKSGTYFLFVKTYRLKNNDEDILGCVNLFIFRNSYLKNHQGQNLHLHHH